MPLEIVTGAAAFSVPAPQLRLVVQVAACLLVELGVKPRDAIDRVRKARSGAIETPAQEKYVLDYSLRG